MTIFHHRIFETKLWKISVEYKFLKLGIEYNSCEGEIFGHVRMRLRIQLLEFFCL